MAKDISEVREAGIKKVEAAEENLRKVREDTDRELFEAQKALTDESNKLKEKDPTLVADTLVAPTKKAAPAKAAAKKEEK